MFGQGIIALFPSIDILVAEETGDVIGVGLNRVIKESCFRKLC